ncbi:MAG TPA: sigma-70 family RNA polymerase sigma factor, partial [Phycisphaerae bacterium]|nr:sigma-70 family RNA polymerase sigma factor [Phycisphaerae bacterium]
MEDGELLAAFARDKSQEAFQELVRRHVDMVYSVCRRQLRDAHWAEDVTQAVFILLARKADSLSGQVVLGGWLYKTAVFACSNARALARTRTYHENRVTPMKAHEEQEDLERAEMEGLLDQGLMELTKSQREVLVLRFFEKIPLAEVARMRQESLYMTQKTLDSGLAKLRRFLAQRGVAAATVAILAAILAEQSAHAVPAGLAASVGSAALTTSALPSYAGNLATQILKQAARAKLMTSLAAVGAVLAFALSLFAMSMPGMSDGKPAAMASNAGKSEGLRSDEIAALRQTLSQAETALRTMDRPALDQVVAFTDPQQAHDWELIWGVFAANQRLKLAAARFGPAKPGQPALTGIKTFGQRLDENLPWVDTAALAWTVQPYSATLKFAYTDKRSESGTIYFIKPDGQWKIDVGRSLEVALDGLGGEGDKTRIAVLQLDVARRAGVVQRLYQMQDALTAVAENIER